MIDELKIRNKIEDMSLEEIKELAFKHLLSNEKSRLRKIKMRNKNKEKDKNANEKN